MSIGEHANDYGNMAEKQKLTDLQLRLRQLIDQTDQIAKEQGYQRVSTLFFSIFAHSYITLLIAVVVCLTLYLLKRLLFIIFPLTD